MTNDQHAYAFWLKTLPDRFDELQRAYDGLMLEATKAKGNFAKAMEVISELRESLTIIIRDNDKARSIVRSALTAINNLSTEKGSST